MRRVMPHMDLHILWFALLGVLLAGYAILDGFDLGVGMLHPFVARTDTERRICLNSIGPIWDGNEVWLVTFGGALFAAFPEAYATIFSGFYIAFMGVIFALIFRAISIEFRSKMETSSWRYVWDYVFCFASLLACLLFGVAVGAAMDGIPLNERGVFVGRFVDQIESYSIATGIMTVAMFVMHGSMFLYLKTEGELQQRVQRILWPAFFTFLGTYVLVTILTFTLHPRATNKYAEHPWVIGVAVLAVLAIANIPRELYRKNAGMAFLSSCAAIAGLVCLFGMALFPNLVTSNPSPEYSLTIYNAASSEKTLGIMAIVAAIGIPFVLTYTFIIYWTFRGKVKLDKHSY